MKAGERINLRKSDAALALLATGLLLLSATVAHSLLAGGAEQRQSADLVRRLGLTDLSLFTEARYTRHLSQADLHAPFQDHPVSLDHFPSGSLASPQRPLREDYLFAPDKFEGKR